VATPKVWVLPTNTPFFELDYPQKSPQCFAIKKPASNPTPEEPQLRSCGRSAPRCQTSRSRGCAPPSASQFPFEPRLTKPIAIFCAPDSASPLQPSPTTQSPTSAVTGHRKIVTYRKNKRDGWLLLALMGTARNRYCVLNVPTTSALLTSAFSVENRVAQMLGRAWQLKKWAAIPWPWTRSHRAGLTAIHRRTWRRPLGIAVLTKCCYSLSTWCTNEIAIDPSPTAEATRFTLPARTSPASPAGTADG
jgi:hypothetical protein